jgi:hypothetical protein
MTGGRLVTRAPDLSFLMRMGPKLPIIGETTAREAAFLFHARYFANVCLWHKADITIVPKHVRFRGQSGHGPDLAKCPLMTQSGHAVAEIAARQNEC